MTLDQAFRDPMVLKAGGAVAIYLLGGGNRTAKWAAAALAAWAAWDWYSRPRLAIDVQGRPVALAPISTTTTTRPAPFSVIPGGAPIEPYNRPGVGGKGFDPAADLGTWRRYHGNQDPPPLSPAWHEWRQTRAGATGLAGEPSDGVQ